VDPLFFGRSDAPLYGVYHPPLKNPRPEAVLLCYPFGQEYMRAHRAFRQLALLLTRAGSHVFRFDYRGTGDSSGEMDEVTPQDWVEDVGIAISELRELAGPVSLTVVGLRLGALLAGVACRNRADVERLVLWDPVLSGDDYQQELIATIDAEPPAEREKSGNGVTPDGTLHYNGFSMNASFRQSLSGLALPGTMPEHVRKVFHIVSHETEDTVRLREQWRGDSRYRYQYTEAPHDWNYVDDFGGILLPQPVIQAIVGWLDAQIR
jgi:pimeloyl-ACP methyl ester carboxylesterase